MRILSRSRETWVRRASAFLLFAPLSLGIASDSLAVWPIDGEAICARTARQYKPSVVSDLLGGAYISWLDARILPMPTGDLQHEVFTSRVNAAGSVYSEWVTNGNNLSNHPGSEFTHRMVPDGSGGALLAWAGSIINSTNLAVMAQRLSASATLPWGSSVFLTQVAVGSISAGRVEVALCSDGNGGAIVVWDDYRASGSDANIFGRHVTSTGTLDWTADGVQITNATGHQTDPVAASDGSGGVIVAWVDRRAGNADVYARRVSAAGTPLWTADGVPLTTAATDQTSLAILPDGSGGAYVAWSDADVYLARILADGTIPAPWVGGILVSGAADVQLLPALVSGGGDSVIVVWKDHRSGNYDVYAQKVTSSGSMLWTSNGVAVVSEPLDQDSHSVATDGDGGCIVAFANATGPGAVDIHAQRITRTGSTLPTWPSDGVAVCAATGVQSETAIHSDGLGGAIVAWEDGRSIGLNDQDIFAARVDGNGITGPPLSVDPSPLSRALGVFPNPSPGTISLHFESKATNAVSASVFDVRGRIVRRLLAREYLPGSDHTLSWDGATDSGTPAPSGLYFLVLQTANERSVHRIALSR